MRGQAKHQGGALLGFVAVAIVLAALLVGGLYFVQRYNATDRSTVADNSNSSSDDKNTSGFTDDTSKNETKSDDSSTSKNTNSSSSASNNSNSNDKTTTGFSREETTAEELPATGPAETLSQLLAIGMLTFGVGSYIRSRRSLDF